MWNLPNYAYEVHSTISIFEEKRDVYDSPDRAEAAAGFNQVWDRSERSDRPGSLLRDEPGVGPHKTPRDQSEVVRGHLDGLQSGGEREEAVVGRGSLIRVRVLHKGEGHD